MDLPLIQQHQHFMKRALNLAEQAYEEDEIPVGAVVVHRGQIIGKGYNQVERLKDATAHAEMLAISAACSTLEQKFLENCTLYVTLEPCPMCSGAIVWSRLGQLVFGAPDSKAGACGTTMNLVQQKTLNHRVECIQGVLENESEMLLQEYFKTKRHKNNGSQ